VRYFCLYNAQGIGQSSTRGWPIRPGDVLPEHTIPGGFWAENLTAYGCGVSTCRGPFGAVLSQLLALLPAGWRPQVSAETIAAAQRRSAVLVRRIQRAAYFHGRRQAARRAAAVYTPTGTAAPSSLSRISCVVCGVSYVATFGHPPTDAEGRAAVPACFIPANQIVCPPGTK
jgi:hypothetical protein